jgi:hypothetical protein
MTKECRHAPDFSNEAERVSKEQIEAYRNELGINPQGNLIDADGKVIDKKTEDTWKFAINISASAASDAQRFRDFVFLQTLSSWLRTELTEDLASRKRPSDR